jgi:uncharacterized protein (UPF0335 family)
MTDGNLQQFVRQIESLNGEIKTLNMDKSEIYKSAKFQGYDPKILRKVIAERAKGPAERAEQDELFRSYWAAVEAERSERAEAAA